jgi:hypothetical protein
LNKKNNISSRKKSFYLFKLIEAIEWAFWNWKCFTERVNIEKYQLSNKCN